jgi:hypothetical protein
VAPFEPLAPAAVAALARFLDGQSLIRGAYLVGTRSRPWPGATVVTEDSLWFDIGGRRKGVVARRALSAGVEPAVRRALAASTGDGPRLQPLRRRLGWNFAGRSKIDETGDAATVLWRPPAAASESRDPLNFDLKWRPLEPPPAFAAEVRALLEACSGIERAWLAEEVLLKDGRELGWHPHLYFEGTERRWPAQTAKALMALGVREWRKMGVGRAAGLPLRPRTATQLFSREQALA